MKGKHMKKTEGTKKRKKRIRLKIVDKKKFVRAVTFLVLFILLIVVLIFRDINNKDYIKQENAVVTEQEERVEETENTQVVAERQDRPQITSRSGETIREPQITTLEFPETWYVNVEKGVNIREFYTTTSNKVKAIPYGTEVKITAKKDNWGQITENEWVLLDNMSTTKPEIKKNENKKLSTNESSSWIKFIATGYCPCSKCCGKTTGITASGTKATAGRTVAMSSKYSFGTKVEIKGMGTYTVEDRGGAIQGNKIDIFFNTHQEALNFGRKTIYLRVVD